MKQRALNVFILNDNAEEAGKLRKYLLKRFSGMLDISLFFNRRSFFNMLDNHVDLVVVDDYHSHTGSTTDPNVQVLDKIRNDHPGTEVVILSSHDDVGTKIAAMNHGAREFILNKRGAWQSVLRIIDQTIQQPMRYLMAEYGVKVFVTAFILVWVALGVISYLALRFWV